jgi:hypothetical protein
MMNHAPLPAATTVYMIPMSAIGMSSSEHATVAHA